MPRFRSIRVTGSDPAVTDYILEQPAKCPNCRREILEKTLVEPVEMASRHLNPYFHWCVGCWKWVCDCVHCVEPLNIKRQPVKDIQIRSLGYDRRRGRLEIEFTWTDDVRQFYPIAPSVYRQLLAAKPMYLFLNRILNAQRIRFDYVRSEAKRAIMMAGIACELLGDLRNG